MFDTLLVASRILGGLALFLFGIGIMTEGLQAAAGDKLRALLERGTRNRWTGLGLGTSLGFLAHSSAATVMAVSFLNAGLLSLTQALPVFFGANIGTTLSMQLISFQLTDFAFVGVAIGFFVQLLAPQGKVRDASRALLGLGLVFWGMSVMSAAIEPHRDLFAAYLAAVDGTTWTGFLSGLAIATMITGIIQSSGAVIGIAFALASAGVYTSLEQVYPIILGAHIGTSATSLLASLGANREAKRGALGNLSFNCFNVLLAILAAPLFLRGIPLLSDNLVHQIAHAHTGVMLAAALLLLPVVGLQSNGLRRLIPVLKTEGRRSYLKYHLIRLPERAIRGILGELGRSLSISRESLEITREWLAGHEPKHLRRIKRNEEIVDELKDAVRFYISALTGRYLSRRQALMIQYLTHISADVERIGDHIDHLADNLNARRSQGDVMNTPGIINMQQDLIDHALEVLKRTETTLSAFPESFEEAAQHILEAREKHNSESKRLQASFNEQVAQHKIPADTGLFFSDFCLTLDRMVRHCRMIANETCQPFFALKESKLDRVEPPLEKISAPPDILQGEPHTNER
ncbi:MAG: Na/Pi cotransporter family protein [Opitutales bacterium]